MHPASSILKLDTIVNAVIKVETSCGIRAGLLITIVMGREGRQSRVDDIAGGSGRPNRRLA